MPGIEGESRYITNSQGLRGDEFSDSQQYRILTIGGSTTICTYLDESEAWPHLLQEKLNSLKSCSVWVGNAGKSAANTRHHLMLMKYLLPQFPKIDALIILVGANDLSHRLGSDTDYNPNFLNQADAEGKQILLSFDTTPYGFSLSPRWSSIKSTALGGLARQAKHLYSSQISGVVEDEAGKSYIKWRENRKNASEILETLPDLNPALEEYGRNLNTLINLAQANGVRLIFMTQPTMWRKDLTPQEKELL
jgi:lysophospholipase L1-like esterase